LAGIGELEVFEKRTTLVVLAAMALLAFAGFVTFGPWVVAHAAPDWWLADQTGWRLARAQARWEAMQIAGWVAIAASPLMLVALGMAVWRLIRRRPVLRIDEQGIWCRFVRQLGIIPWSDISGAFIATGVSGRRVQIQLRFLCLKLRDVATYRERAGRAHHVAHDRLKLPDFHIMGMMGATPPAEEVEAFINAAVARRGGAD
jgi:hypothetical protein